MIKFIAAALIAIVVVGHVSAGDDSEAEQETSLLLGNERMFADFCIASREAITSDIKKRVDQQSSKIFKLFFGNFFIEIADEVLGVAREDVQKFSESIATPPSLQSAPSGPISEEELQQRVEDSVEAMMDRVDQGVFGRLSAATSEVVQTMFKTMKSALFVKLTKIRSQMTKENFLQGFVDSCRQVAEYEKQLIANLDEEKARLLESVKDPKVERMIRDMDIEELPCETSRHITRLDGACNVLIGGTNWFLKMWGIDSKVDFPQPSQLAGPVSKN